MPLNSFLLEKSLAKRIEILKETAQQTSKTLSHLRAHLDGVRLTAQEIAATASSHALEATGKLLNQSENLQSMLDRLLTKMEQVSDSKTEKDPETSSTLYDSIGDHNPEKI